MPSNSISDFKIAFISAFKCCINHNLDSLVSKLWDLESIGISTDLSKFEDITAMDQFKNSISFSEGRYTARLPWKSSHPQLKTNYSLALGRLNSTLKHLRRNQDHLKFYNEVITDQLSKDFIEEVQSPERFEGNKVSYLPHLPVWALRFRHNSFKSCL